MPEIAHLVIGLLTAGTGAIFFLAERDSHTTRPLALCLAAIGISLFIDDHSDGGLLWLRAAVSVCLQAVAILAGVEWGRRIGLTTHARLRRTANALFRASQLLVLVYWGLSLGYLALFPDIATTYASGPVKVRGVEFAVYAPVLGTAMLLAAIAILILRMRIDAAEAVRLRALFWAAPFLMAGLIVSETFVPITLAVGLLVFIYGSTRYLIIQGRRGQFMSQFLSPEVARLVKTEGMEQVLQRERRPISVVICDLRGFTAFASKHDSDTVVETLERYYHIVGEAAAELGGTIKDHAGDGVLILVGAPLPLKDHARRAAQLALAIMQRVQAMLADTPAALGLGIGVATGKATIGALRGAGRLEYVAVGDPVNLAARLCDRAADGEILVDQHTQIALEAVDTVQTKAAGTEMLKGFKEPITVSALTPADGHAE